MNARDELPSGMLELLILKTVSQTAMHGYGIAQHVQRLSNEVLRVEEGTLYPALHRLRQKGWIKASWKQTPNNQRARYYAITPAGRRQLGEAELSFNRLMAAIARVLRAV